MWRTCGLHASDALTMATEVVWPPNGGGEPVDLYYNPARGLASRLFEASHDAWNVRPRVVRLAGKPADRQAR